MQSPVELDSPQTRNANLSAALAWLEVALTGLTPGERACLLLREQHGLSVAEIAERMGLERERVRSALFSARERLRSSLPSEAAADAAR